MNRFRLVCAVLLGLLLSMTGAASARTFGEFLAAFEARAVAAGISRDVYRNSVAGLTPDPSIPQFTASQPEFETPVWSYLDKRVSGERIARGQRAMARNQALFDRVSRQFGVDPFVLAAIWGLESDYGAVLDSSLIKPVIRSLATLVFHERDRVKADEAELIAALRIIQQGDARADTLVGSWAGAIGHLQLIPTAFIDHAIDFDGDGVRDPHNSLADALGSSAKFLTDLGYQPGQDWGYEVALPGGFDYSLAGRDRMRPVSFFAERGVRRVKGRQFADMAEPVFLFVPAGRDGPAFLMTANYKVFKRYNFSDSYALAVAQLTDRLKGEGPLAASWPRDAHFLNRSERIELQERLKRAGHYTGGIDGRLGPLTAAALRDWQAEAGLVADGFATREALASLRANQDGR